MYLNINIQLYGCGQHRFITEGHREEQVGEGVIGDGYRWIKFEGSRSLMGDEVLLGNLGDVFTLLTSHLYMI